MTKQTGKGLEWKVHTPSLLEQVLDNPGTHILKIPLNILSNLLFQVANRAIEIDDPVLNNLMCQLTLYSVADPYSQDYNPCHLKEIAKAAELAKNQKD